jgi:hypothetical protein
MLVITQRKGAPLSSGVSDVITDSSQFPRPGVKRSCD